MSPEQARGQSVDGRSDLFSLGLVMHFCLTNTLLYNGDNDLDILFRAACGPTTEDLEMIALLPAPADRIIARALAMDPAHRYANAQEFALDLAPFVTNRKTEMAHLMAQLFGDELAKEAADAA
jgi:serine/threonine-protein kinase